MQFDNTFFAFVALVLFLGIVVYLGVPRTVGAALDDRAAKIAKELDDARKLRQDAESLLAEYKQKRSDAEKEAAGIISQARREAESMAAENTKKLADMLLRRTKQAEQKIAQAEAAAVKEVRSLATDAAIAAAAKLLGDGSANAKSAALIAESIAAVKTRLN
jgi:F-type H+-transporting ATPase subunit b